MRYPLLWGGTEVVGSTTVDKVSILSGFPSPFFSNLGVKSPSAAHDTEIYYLSEFISFLFSPCSSYHREEKIQIVNNMICYFSASIYRSFFLLASGVDKQSEVRAPSTFKAGREVMYPLPCVVGHSGNQGSKYVKIESKKLSEAIEHCYMDAPGLIKNSMIFLDIAIHLLQKERSNDFLQNVAFFYKECLNRSYDAELIKSSFSPEIQCHLDTLM